MSLKPQPTQTVRSPAPIHRLATDLHLSQAICALSPSADASYLAYPSPVPSPTSPLATQETSTQPSPSSVPAQSGDVLLFSTRSLTVANVIQAHKAPISFLCINSTGTLLATASDKGTVIRVWSIPGADKLYQFRRGTREARIYSMNFNVMSTLLAVSSAHDTVHIFKLGPHKAASSSSSSSSSTSRNGQPPSPEGSIDSREAVQGLDGGYEAFIQEKKSGSVSCVSTHIILYPFSDSCNPQGRVYGGRASK
jgi:autophagy-related protein 18